MAGTGTQTLGAARPRPRRFGAVNWRGVWSLYRRDVLRFLRYSGESIAGPAVSSLMFLAVFELALGGGGDVVPGVALAQFIAPGIVVFNMTHSAFESAAVAILHDKMEGMIGDVMGAPLTALEIVAGYGLAATSNALTVGAVILCLMVIFVDLPLHAPAAVAGFAIAGAVLFALVGVIVGVVGERWDSFSAAETFLVLPLGLLSGGFFAVETLAAEARWAVAANPVFYVVEGFRYGFTGQTHASIALAAAVLVVLGATLAGIAWRLFAMGYKLKP